MDQYLKDFLPNLRCPITGNTLHELSLQELENLNAAILEEKVLTTEGLLVKEPIQGALASTGAEYIYPVIDGYLAVLLPERAYTAEGSISERKLYPAEKKSVQEFYDSYGWVKTDDGYKDTIAFEDRRPVSEKYWSRCHLRLNNYLPGGRYLLDVASGSIPNDEYLTYSEAYRLRICMDFSHLALREAAQRLNGKGVFILGDMTRMPITDNCIDSVISMHTVYHVPQREQTKAVEESYRVLRPEGQAVIVYSWNKPLLMKLVYKMWKPLLRLYKLLTRKKSNSLTRVQTAGRPELFVQQQPYEWYTREVQKPFHGKLRVYSSISRSFSNTFLREKAFGRQLAKIIYRLEDWFPSILGRWGQYPVFILQKRNPSVANEQQGKRISGQNMVKEKAKA